MNLIIIQIINYIMVIMDIQILCKIHTCNNILMIILIIILKI